METGLTKQRAIVELTRSPHGDLKQYLPIAKQMALEDAEFLAHLIAWNAQHGQIRDARVALPVAMIKSTTAYRENALAHLALLDPRNLVRALRFGREIGTPGAGHEIRRMVERYLRVREAKQHRWIATVLQHRASMKALYAMYHVRPSPVYDAMLFKGVRPPGSALDAVARLKEMSTRDAAAAIMQHKLPFLVIVQALGAKARDTDLVLAMIEQMSAAELVTNSKLLLKLGVKNVPALRAAYEAGLMKVAESKTVTLKTGVAAKAVGDEKLAKKLTAVQEKQIANLSIDGNWLVLGDKSGSMKHAIEATRIVAGTLAKFSKGETHLIFFDNGGRHLAVTGFTYDQVMEATQSITASGGTSCGIGVQYAVEKGLDVTGIAIVSDGGENAGPFFHEAYKRLCEKTGTVPPVYFYLLDGEANVLSGRLRTAGIEFQEFDLRGGKLDYYSLPNLVQTMRASRYSLLDDVMAAKLLTLDDVLGEEVNHAAGRAA